MRFIDYFKNNVIGIGIYLLGLITSIIMLMLFNVQPVVLLLIMFILLFNGIIIILINYFRKNKFYKEFNNNLKRLSKKYLILETIPQPDTYEEQVLVDALYEINKSMVEAINEYRKNITEFKEFVEIWIHEAKIPISSMVLKCHNKKDKYDKTFLSLLRRLDNNIDEILYYVRSENTEKDFAITEVNLKDVIRNVGIKNKDDLLENNVTFETDIKVLNVHTDKKWLEYIINQIINNSIKYKKDSNAVIKISSYEDDDKVSLEIYDNGIGIPKKDIGRVFEKSFTGTNGREKTKSTGMGLYIIKKLCDKLGHNIYIDSTEKEYTKVIIEFGKNDIYKF